MYKILIIEDDMHISELVKYNLKQSGYEVEVAKDGEIGLKMINDIVPDLIILDIMMPKLDGIGVLSKLRKDESAKNIPVIMLTAKSAEMDKIIGLEEGADDYMTKPFSISELIARVKAHLRREERKVESQEIEDIMKVKYITLNKSTFEVFKNGNKVELSLKEFELLKMLFENKNNVITRDQILNKIWGYDYFGETRTVDVHIRNLRKKLEDENEKIIATVRGVGYKVRL